MAAWRRYRSDYPTGILRLETDLSIIEVLARTGETDEALVEATDFLRRHPDSERRGGDRPGGGRPLPFARRLPAGPSAPTRLPPRQPGPEMSRRRPRSHRAACLVRLGDAGGPDAVRAYLRANPAGRFRTEARALLDSDGRER